MPNPQSFVTMIKYVFQCGPIVFFISILLLTSCDSASDRTEVLAPLAPSTEADIVRFDRAVKEIPAGHLLQSMDSLSLLYPGFSAIWINQLLDARSPELLLEELKIVHEDSSFIKLYDEVQSTLGDLPIVSKQISQALENYQTLLSLPQKALPSIYTFISGFTYQAFLFDDQNKNGIGIGLDMYLGADFPYQKIHPTNASFSNYLVRTYNKDHIVRKVVEVLIEDILLTPEKEDFLNFMIWGGKKLYLMDQILDFVPDTIVTEYTQAQLDWCHDNEADIWNFFFEKDLFYETDIRKFNKLIAPAPTSPGMPAEAPGQTANFMGWQIIKAYMSRYPSTDIRDLILMNDAQQLLDLSKYKPTR